MVPAQRWCDVTQDIAVLPLHKNDIQDLRWVAFFLNDTEVWLAHG